MRTRWWKRSRPVWLALSLLAVSASGVMVAFALPESGSPSVDASRVVVKGSDRSARVSPSTVTVGKTLFRIVNSGKKSHFFAIKGKRMKLKPRKTLVVAIAFPSRGEFRWSWSGTKAHGVLRVRSAGVTHTSTSVATITTVVTNPTVGTTTTVATTTYSRDHHVATHDDRAARRPR